MAESHPRPRSSEDRASASEAEGPCSSHGGGTCLVWARASSLECSLLQRRKEFQRRIFGDGSRLGRSCFSYVLYLPQIYSHFFPFWAKFLECIFSNASIGSMIARQISPTVLMSTQPQWRNACGLQRHELNLCPTALLNRSIQMSVDGLKRRVYSSGHSTGPCCQRNL